MPAHLMLRDHVDTIPETDSRLEVSGHQGEEESQSSTAVRKHEELAIEMGLASPAGSAGALLPVSGLPEPPPGADPI
jgi:hypothetical protein